MRELIINRILNQVEEMEEEGYNLFDDTNISCMNEVYELSDELLLDFYEYLTGFRG